MRNSVLMTVAVLLAACQTPPSNAEGEKPEAEANADAAPADGPASEQAPSDAELSNEARLAKAREYADQNKDEMFEVEPLTEEEQRLVDADPETLSAEEKKARSYALRKKILQDPNSPQAKALKDAANRIVEGEVDPNLDYKENGQSSAPPAE